MKFHSNINPTLLYTATNDIEWVIRKPIAADRRTGDLFWSVAARGHVLIPGRVYYNLLLIHVLIWFYGRKKKTVIIRLLSN